MKSTTLALLALALPAITLPLTAQCPTAFSLTTAAPSTGQAGVMFDLEPTGGQALRIESFDVYVTGTVTYEVWVRPALQSFVGFQSTMAGWTLLGTTTGVVGGGTTAPVPLNLCLGYTLQPGGRTGFYITTVSSGTHWYFSGGTVGAVGAPWVSNSQLTVYVGHAGAYFNTTISPRAFGGSVHYGLGNNILTLSQSGPGVGDLGIVLAAITPSAAEGITLMSYDVALPLSSGPMFGIWPDALSWSLLSSNPIFDGSPLHFPIPSQFGLFPTTPFIAPPGTVSFLAGQTVDMVTGLLAPGLVYVGRSNVVRFTFQ